MKLIKYTNKLFPSCNITASYFHMQTLQGKSRNQNTSCNKIIEYTPYNMTSTAKGLGDKNGARILKEKNRQK